MVKSLPGEDPSLENQTEKIAPASLVAATMRAGACDSSPVHPTSSSTSTMSR
ncbi:MAG: hypothetical protein JRG91_20690 [Deltaproteobacteria bacterium]|nr:hypothetical protein [Deltaproteobacteria bacterium]